MEPSDDILKTLIQQGMSRKEAKVYLTTLELGSAPASTIARHAEEKRTTVYALLKKMTGDGTVQKIERKNVTYFSAVSPEIFLKHLESKAESFKDITPKLLEITGSKGSKPNITYLEGKKGIQSMFEDFALSEVSMRAILGTPKYFEFGEYVDVYRRARKENNLKTYRILSKKNSDPEKLKIDDKKFSRETKLLDKLPYDIKTDINIYGPNKISVLFFDKGGMPYIIIIESKDMYESMYSMFDFIRECAEGL